MTLSICIPSYNRPHELIRLLNSINGQKGDFEIIIAEDYSPERAKIKALVEEYISLHPELKIKLYFNEVNLGYDKNIRNLLSLAKGDFVMYFGDDDILSAGALEKVLNVIANNENLGVILRGWEERDQNNKVLEFSKYSSHDTCDEPGIDTVIDYFRKSIFISGLTLHRESALKLFTEKLDGTLLYQVYLVSNILLHRKAYYISDILVIRMAGGEFFFGSAESEKEHFVPNELNSLQSLNFMKGFLKVIEHVELLNNISIQKNIQIDFSKRSYGYLSIQRKNGFLNFIKYVIELYKLGFGRSTYFYIYALALLCLGEKTTNDLFLYFKKLIGQSPQL